jgi:RNA chaperone Hfq
MWRRKVKQKEKEMNDYTEQQYIKNLIEKGLRVYVFLRGNSMKLLGTIVAQDDFSILIGKEKGGTLMVYKDAIGSITKYNDQ